MTHSNTLVRKSSEHLARNFGDYSDWPAVYSNTSSPAWLASADVKATVRQFEIEVQALDDTRGLEWLIVVATVRQRLCERQKQADREHLHCECKPNFRTALPGDIERAPEYADMDCVFCSADRAICCAEAQKVGQKCASTEQQLEAGCITCNGGSRVTARRGFFVMRKPQGLRVFRCLDHLCLGTADESSDNRTGIEPRCPDDAEDMVDGNCCLKGHEGPLCGLCKEGYTWSDDMVCVPCTSPSISRVFMIFASLLLFISYSVLSKHYFIMKKASSQDKSADRLKSTACCRIPWSSWCFLVPLGTDLPETGGSELQTLTFWMQSFTLLEIDGNQSWWWILSMIFHFKPSSGVKVCPFALTPFEKWWVDVLGPTLFLLSAGLVMHCMVCVHMVHRSGGLPLPCSRREAKKFMLVKGANITSKEDLIMLFNRTRGCGVVTRLSMWYSFDEGKSTASALVKMSEDVNITLIEAQLNELKNLNGSQVPAELSVAEFDYDFVRQTSGGVDGLTFRATFLRQLHKFKAVVLDVAIYSVMPVMTKSLVITHCRSDTPDGTARVIRLPEISCEGGTYSLTYAVAILLFVAFGFCMPLWLGWQLFLRVDAPTAELEKHSIWVGNPHRAYGDSTGTGVASKSLRARLKDRILNMVECLTGKDLDGDGDVGAHGSALAIFEMWQRMFYAHLGAARAGFPSDMELIRAWEYRSGADAVAASGIFEFNHIDSVHDDLVQTGIKASRRTVMSGLKRAKTMLSGEEDHFADRVVLEENRVLAQGSFKDSRNFMKAQDLQTGHVKAWLQDPDTETPASISNYRSKLRDEDGYRTLVRWAYENRIREIFTTGLTSHEGYTKIVAERSHQIEKLASDQAANMGELLNQSPVLSVEVFMAEVNQASKDDETTRDWSDRLRRDLVSGLESKQLNREQLCARAARDDVEVCDSDADSEIIEKIVMAHQQIPISTMENGADVLVPIWALVTFKSAAAADFALDVAASLKGLTSSRTGKTETDLVRSDVHKSMLGHHLRTILKRFPTTLHAQSFDAEGALKHRGNHCAWMSAQNLLEKYRKTQASKLMLSFTAVLEAIGGSGQHTTGGQKSGSGRGGSHLTSVYWSTMTNGARSRRDWLLPMYSDVHERCWWWSAALLLRRTAVAMFSSRRDGERFQVFGTDSDWRAMVVLTLAINIFLSSVYRPYKRPETNYFSDFAISILLVLYMFTASGEKKFFTLVAFLAAVVLLPALVYAMWKKARRHNETKANWGRVRQATKFNAVMAATGRARNGQQVSVIQEGGGWTSGPSADTSSHPRGSDESSVSQLNAEDEVELLALHD